jgi:hypothetical protein
MLVLAVRCESDTLLAALALCDYRARKALELPEEVLRKTRWRSSLPMSIVLYHRGGAQDFDTCGANSTNLLGKYNHNASDLLRIRGHRLALELFSRFPWDLREATNSNGDDFSVLYATVGLQLYEEARSFSELPEHRSAFRQIAETVTEIGPYIRFIAVALDPNRKPERDSRALTPGEIHKLVNNYIGVSGGYLGDFSYRTHREFYLDLELDFDPDKLEGTTRLRFTKILSEATPEVQARILQGILDNTLVQIGSLRS